MSNDLELQYLQQRVADLQSKLEVTQNELIQRQGERPSSLSHTGGRTGTKRGYLFKWMDRAIGWGGTKWALRFVTLEHGRLSYYLTHTDTAPRYALNLRGCAVQDEGWKRNRRHRPKDGNWEKAPPLDEPGAYFFVFSVYLRNDDIGSARDGEGDGNAEDDSNNSKMEIVPLLRFSTPSMAEKMQWIQLISDACAYCETEKFLRDEAAREFEAALQLQQQQNMSNAMPEAKEGVLPPLIFVEAKPITMLNRHPSSNRLPSTNGSNHKRKPSQKNHFLTKSSESDVDKKDAKSTRGYPPSKPMHREAAPSYLSIEAKTQNFRGFLNLGILILIVSNFRLLLDTIRKHGFILNNLIVSAKDLSEFCSSLLRGDILVEQFPLISGFVFMFGFVTMALALEWFLSRKKLENNVGMPLHYLNAHGSFAVSIYIVWNLIDSPLMGAVLLFHATITWMKLISYAHANEDYRLTAFDSSNQSNKYNQNLKGSKRKDKESNMPRSSSSPLLVMVENLDMGRENISYPQNISFSNIIYFWFAPTLTYQIAFPMYPCIRWFRAFQLVLRIIICAALMSFLVAQVVNPSLEGLLIDLEKNKGTYTAGIFAEYWLKLTITSTYLWLLMFYGYFHCVLNLVAELLRFGDRVFYKDWWNSSTASSFWRLWNMPVHYWLIRHVYFPCLRFKGLRLGKGGATIAVFLVSAIIHELEVSVPFHMVRPWSFLGMMGQIPLVYITKVVDRKYRGSSFGNIIFWISFCVVGQPMAVLLYTIDYRYRVMEGEMAALAGSVDDIGTTQDECRIRWGDRCIIK